MTKLMCAACVIVVVGFGCTAGNPATDATAKVAIATADDEAARSHVDMYAMDSTMFLDHAVFSELAADPSVLQPIGIAIASSIDRVKLHRKLGKAGYPVGGARLAEALAVSRETSRSSVTGDAQALVVATAGQLRYGPELDLLFPDKPVKEKTLTNGKFHWVAAVINTTTSEGYEPLKIAAGEAACLYAGQSATNGFVAYWFKPIVTVGCDGTGPLEEVDLKPALRLAVLRTAAGDDFGEVDVPKAARFEWGTNKVQMIGVKCGEQWCQVAPIGTAIADLEPIPAVPSDWDKEERRNRKMKGRFDYQMLSDRGPTGALVPSGIMARLLPAKKAGMQQPGTKRHVGVAEVQLEGAAVTIPTKYVTMGFNFGTNIVSLCRGTFQECKGTGEPSAALCDGSQDLWGQVINTTHGTEGPVFRVCYLESSKPTDEWITRWNWQPLDEGLWVRCLNGCCSPKL